MHTVMSALPPKADMCGALGDVRFVPIADMAPLFDHLVGTGQQRGWHGEAECLGGLEIDHELVLGRRLHRQVCWLLAFQNAVDVARRAAVWIDQVRAIGCQAAAGGEVTKRIDRGQAMLGCELDDQIAIDQRSWA